MHADRSRLRQSSKKGELAGTFALRSSHRPNPIGAAVVKIKSISGSIIVVRGLDCLTGTLLLDIKPAMSTESRKIAAND